MRALGALTVGRVESAFRQTQPKQTRTVALLIPREASAPGNIALIAFVSVFPDLLLSFLSAVLFLSPWPCSAGFLPRPFSLRIADRSLTRLLFSFSSLFPRPTTYPISPCKHTTPPLLFGPLHRSMKFAMREHGVQCLI